MRFLGIILMTLICSPVYSRIQIADHLTPSVAGSVHFQNSDLILSKNQFSSFIACGRDEADVNGVALDSPAYNCLSRHFHPQATKANFLNYLEWLHRDIVVSSLSECSTDQKDKIELIRKDKKDMYFCFIAKQGAKQETAVIGFRKIKSQPLILHIKTSL